MHGVTCATCTEKSSGGSNANSPAVSKPAAESPEEALQMETEHSGSIDLLLTDVVMSGQNGRDLANQLMANR